MKSLVGVVLALVASTSVWAANVAPIRSTEELEHFMQTYYQDPNPERIEQAIAYVGTTSLTNKPEARAALLMSFACLFDQGSAAQVRQWADSVDKIDEPARSLLQLSLKNKPAALLSAVAESPARNDMNWSCYFATGDQQYLNNIMAELQYLGERKNMNRYLTAASARWSLASNAREHKAVHAVLEAASHGPEGVLRDEAASVLRTEPQTIKAETLTVVDEIKRNSGD